MLTIAYRINQSVVLVLVQGWVPAGGDQCVVQVLVRGWVPVGGDQCVVQVQVREPV